MHGGIFARYFSYHDNLLSVKDSQGVVKNDSYGSSVRCAKTLTEYYTDAECTNMITLDMAMIMLGHKPFETCTLEDEL